VLAGDVPENRELVKDIGFTFERGSAAHLAGMIRFLIANPVIREQYLWPQGGYGY